MSNVLKGTLIGACFPGLILLVNQIFGSDFALAVLLMSVFAFVGACVGKIMDT